MHCYQPISNLSVISKLLKRLVARQLLDYHRAVKLLPEQQSAYRAFHSTKTAVLKVLADILLALDTGDIAVSAAFDTVDHATLLRRLETSYGIGSTVLGWFASYLSKHIQHVCFWCLSRPVWSTTRIGPWTEFVLTLHCGPTVARWASQSASAHVRRRHADLRLLSSNSSLTAPAASVCVYWRRSFVDAVKPAPAKYRQDRGPLVCVKSTATSTTTGRIESSHRLRHANNLSPRPRNLRQLRRVPADPRVQDRVQLLHHITPLVQHSSVDVTSGTTVAGRLAGVVAPGLWQRDARRSTWQPARQTSLWWTPLQDLFALKYEHITLLLCDLHWLRVPQRIVFKLSVLVFRCLHVTTPPYLASELRCVADMDTRKRLRSPSTPALSYHLHVVRRLATTRSSSLRRVPGTLCHPASLRLRHWAPSSVVW